MKRRSRIATDVKVCKT